MPIKKAAGSGEAAGQGSGGNGQTTGRSVGPGLPAGHRARGNSPGSRLCEAFHCDAPSAAAACAGEGGAEWQPG